MGSCELEPKPDFNASVAWAEVGKGPYRKSNTKASDIIKPEDRVFHRMIVYSINQRKAIQEKVPESDVWLLTQLANHESKTNLPFVLAKMFTNTVEIRDRAGSGLCGGQYITRIAKNLNVLSSEVINSLTLVGEMDFIDRSLLKGMKVVIPGELKGSYIWNPVADNSENEDIQDTPSPGGATTSGMKRKRATDEVIDAIADLKDLVQITEGKAKKRYQRMAYQMHAIQAQLAWQTGSMMDYFASVGFEPDPFQPVPIWPSGEAAPPGFASWDDWAHRDDL